VNKRFVNSFVLLSALWGAWSVAGADEEDRARQDRDRPVAKLFDANGKFVGKVVYSMSSASAGGVILDIHGALVYAGISRITGPTGSESATQLQWTGLPAAYSGPNCSGTVYIPYAAGPLRPASIIRSGATAMLHVASGAPSQYVTVRSEEVYGGGPCTDSYQPYQSLVWTVESTFDLTQNYPEPLRIGR
jgi:hypothetical protein